MEHDTQRWTATPLIADNKNETKARSISIGLRATFPTFSVIDFDKRRSQTLPTDELPNLNPSGNQSPTAPERKWKLKKDSFEKYVQFFYKFARKHPPTSLQSSDDYQYYVQKQMTERYTNRAISSSLINRLLEEKLRSSSTGNLLELASKAEWENTEYCVLCGTQFGTLLKKKVLLYCITYFTQHHCRKCGHAVCFNCSKYRIIEFHFHNALLHFHC